MNRITSLLVSAACVGLFGCVGTDLDGVEEQSYALTTDNAVLTIGRQTAPSYTRGFLSGSYGSISPTALTDGRTYYTLIDKYLPAKEGEVFNLAIFTLAGFTSDPGKAYLTSVKAQGVTKTGASSTYSYQAATGRAQWSWTNAFGFALPPTATTNVTVIHQ